MFKTIVNCLLSLMLFLYLTKAIRRVWKPFTKNLIILWKIIELKIDKKRELLRNFLRDYVEPRIDKKYFILWDHMKLEGRKLLLLFSKIWNKFKLGWDKLWVKIKLKIKKSWNIFLKIWNFNKVDPDELLKSLESNLSLKRLLYYIMLFLAGLVFFIIIYIYIFMYMVKFFYITTLVFYIDRQFKNYQAKKISFYQFRKRVTLAIILDIWFIHIFIFPILNYR